MSPSSTRVEPQARGPGPTPLAHVGQNTREGVVLAGVLLGVFAVIAMWWSDTAASTVQGFGPSLIAAGRITGLVGSYLVVIEVLLMARVTPLDRLIGMDRLALWHRRNGEYAISLLVAHALLTTWGYAVFTHSGLIRETSSILVSYPDTMMATVGLGLFVAVGILSARAVRRRVSYHTWYFIHLYTYLALALSFAHQFAVGADFMTHPLNRALWVALYASVGLLLVTYRVVKPIRDNVVHRLRVARVTSEGPNLTSIYVTGRRLEDLAVEAGQFFLWRFATRSGWWQAHPYSLSAAPNGQWLRLTVKELGDHSGELSSLPVGTRVTAEGPYGAFTIDRRKRRKVLLIGGGVGITPLRALFESLPGRPGDVTMIYRAPTDDEIAFKDEIAVIARARSAKVHFLTGSRREHPEYLTPRHLRSLVPDITAHDVYVCGPHQMTTSVARTLEHLGVPRRHIHREDFEF